MSVTYPEGDPAGSPRPMNSLFKSSVPGASPGASAMTPAICPPAPVASHIAGSDVLSGDPKGGGHQYHEARIVSPIPPSSGNRDPTARIPPRPGPAGWEC